MRVSVFETENFESQSQLQRPILLCVSLSFETETGKLLMFEIETSVRTIFETKTTRDQALDDETESLSDLCV